LNEAVRQVADLTKPRWYDIPQREGITIDLRMALDETLPPIAGVGAEIREALTNLIFNAVDAIVAKGTPTASSSFGRDGEMNGRSWK
jgi:signal transduction histidine kinase